jgi:hypothetical protein
MKEGIRKMGTILVDIQILWEIITQKTKNEGENIKANLMEAGSTKFGI